jgi:hypothetical protein
MAVVTNGGGYGRFTSTDTSRQQNIAETAKQSANNGQGIFSSFSPNNGNQTTTAGSVDPADARRAQAGVAKGGAAAVAKSSTQDPKVQFGPSDESGNDWRVKVSINPSSKILYWDPNTTGNLPGLLAPLKLTDGFIFPYVPQVTVAHSANYTSVSLTHSNYAQYFYESSSVASISISGEFTVQNTDEAKYFLAAIYFFRACTKMFYGLSGDYQGSPPPIVYLDGYGQHYLPHVPCVVTSFSHTMPNDVDYLEVMTPQSITTTTEKATNASSYYPSQLNNQNTDLTTQTINTAYNRVPTASTFSLTLQPDISRTQAVDFDYREFARGGLIAGKGSPYSGGYL